MIGKRRRPGASAPILVSLLVGALACHSGPGQVPAGRLALPRAHEPVAAPFDVEHYALDLVLEPARRRIDGVCGVRFVALEPLERIELDLAGLAVDSVHDAEGTPLAFAHAGGALAIELGRRLRAGASGEVRIGYGGTPLKGLWFVAERNGVPTQVFTQGECEDARWWFPCRDVPSERATSEVRVTMPVGWRAIAAGERVERREEGALATELWRMGTPHPGYLVTLVAGELVEERASWDGVPLVALVPPEHAALAGAAFERTGDILAFFSEITGVRYPYPKYSQACVADFPFGGMENISATTLTETTLKDERGRRDGTSEGLVAHEAAHQWFGDLVTCREWSHIWLNEGFATYLTALWFERSEGVDALRRRMRAIQESYVSQDVGAARRPTVWNVYRDPMDLFFDGHAYPGGAARLHHLRFVVGDRAFFRGVRLYVGGNAGRSVETNDLREAMEEASGEDLGWFFEQWFERRGFPEIEVRWRYDANRKRVSVAVDQVQEIADGTPTVFRTPVDVEVMTASGPRNHRLAIDQRRHLFDLPSDEEPVWVRFDKHGWIPKTLRSRKDVDEWLSLASRDDDVNGRLDAVRALGKAALALDGAAEGEERLAAIDRERLANALLDRLSGDIDASVRSAAAEELGRLREDVLARALRAASELAAGEATGKRKREVAPVHVREQDVPLAASIRSRLEHAARRDDEAGVRVASLAALARAVDSELAAFAEEVFEAGYSWKTMTKAAELLARARRDEQDGARSWLASRMELPSPHATLRAGLVGAFVELGGPADLDRLRTLARDRAEPDAVRAAAARGMGELLEEAGALAPVARDDVRLDVVRELAELLKERSFRLRGAALDGLASLADPRTVPILLAYYDLSVFPRERRKIERAIETLASPTQP